jgi:hypothetical protein
VFIYECKRTEEKFVELLAKKEREIQEFKGRV